MRRDFLESRSRARSAMPGSTLPGPHPQPVANGQSQRYRSERTPISRTPDGTNVLPIERSRRSAVSTLYLEVPSHACTDAAASLLVHQSDFNTYTMVQARTLFGYCHRFIQVIHSYQDIASNG